MNTQAISLSALSKRLIEYEKLPVPLSEEAQQNVLKSLAANLLNIPFLAGVPELLTTASGGGFFGPLGLVYFPASLLGGLGTLLQGASVILLPASVASLVLTAIVLIESSGMRRPVPEWVHRLAFAAVIPAGVTTVVTGATTVAALTVTGVTLVVWIVLIAVMIVLGVAAGLLLLGILAAMAGAR